MHGKNGMTNKRKSLISAKRNTNKNKLSTLENDKLKYMWQAWIQDTDRIPQGPMDKFVRMVADEFNLTMSEATQAIRRAKKWPNQVNKQQ
jgi:hypothetical protein